MSCPRRVCSGIRLRQDAEGLPQLPIWASWPEMRFGSLVRVRRRDGARPSRLSTTPPAVLKPSDSSASLAATFQMGWLLCPQARISALPCGHRPSSRIPKCALWEYRATLSPRKDRTRRSDGSTPCRSLRRPRRRIFPAHGARTTARNCRTSGGSCCVR